MRRLLTRLFGHRVNTPRRSRPARRALQLESLEDRLVPSTFVVDTFDDVLLPNKTSLRRAISLANNNPGPDTIQLPPGTFQLTRIGGDSSLDDGGDLDIFGPLTIQGFPSNDGNRTVIQGNPNSLVRDRLFEVHGPLAVT